MKTITLLIALIISNCKFTQSQIPPQAFNYSAVARNSSGQPISLSTIGIQMTILKTSTNGISVYSENHFVNTDVYGLFNLIVGAGAIQNGSFSTIDWSNDNYFLKVGMDANGGTNFLTMGTTQLLSVPYALHASTADSLIGGIPNFSGNYNDLTNAPNLSSVAISGDYSDLTNQPLTINSISSNGDTLFLSNGQVFISASDIGFSGNYNELSNLPSIPTNLSSMTNDVGFVTTDNDNQQLSVSTTGDTLFISDGNWVIIPGISAANYSGGGGNGIYISGNGVTDIDGNTYSSIIINGQEWMAENLRTTKYANGDVIPNITDGTQWTNLSTGAWSHYNNDPSYENPYGKLYNFYSVIDIRNVCPSGWHAPSDSEWITLMTSLGGQNVAGGKMKSTGTQYWLSPNADASNISGFSALPGGYRYDTGFFDLGNYGGFWGIDNPTFASRSLSKDNGILNTSTGQNGWSVRCLKN